MNLENFHSFLSEPSNLFRISYSELKSLAAEYPYSTNLRILLLLKSKLEKNPELAHNLKLASTYAPDRSVLYKVMHDSKLTKALREEISEKEEFLELKDLTEVKSLLEKETNQENENTLNFLTKEIPAASSPKNENWAQNLFSEESAIGKQETEIPSVISIDSLINSISKENDGNNILEEEQEEISFSNQLIQNFAIENLSGFTAMLGNFDLTSDTLPLEIENEPAPTGKKAVPMPKDSFASWLTQIEKDLNREPETPDINKNLEEIAKKEVNEAPKPEADEPVSEQEKKKPKKLKVKKFAEKSLSLNDGIISETLANLLVKQERYDKAIEMYEKLSLKYPEKRAIFAAQIDKFKNKLI